VKLARDFTPLSDRADAGARRADETVSKQALFFRFFDRA